MDEGGDAGRADLERYHLGLIAEPELSTVDDHLLWCHECIDRAEAAADYVDNIRIALLRVNDV